MAIRAAVRPNHTDRVARLGNVPEYHRHARLELEVPALTLEESALALSALLTLSRVPADGTAEEALNALLRRHGLRPARIVAA